MKSKFVLTEEESKRILSLHKKEINERNINDQNLILERWEYTIKGTYYAGCPDGGDLMIKPGYKFVYNSSKDYAMYYDEDGNKEGFFNCKTKTFNEGGNNKCQSNKLAPIITREVCKRNTTPTPTPPPTPTKKGCPSIVKSFTDSGYTQITEKRYKELAGNNTRIRKYKYCPVTKKNLFFAKPKATETGPAPTPTPNPVVTGGGGGQIYPFDYDTILKAFPEEEIVNPFEQGGEEGTQPIVVTDKTFGLF